MQITVKCSLLFYLFLSTESNINYLNMTLFYDIRNKKMKQGNMPFEQSNRKQNRKTIESTQQPQQLASTFESFK